MPSLPKAHASLLTLAMSPSAVVFLSAIFLISVSLASVVGLVANTFSPRISVFAGLVVAGSCFCGLLRYQLIPSFQLSTRVLWAIAGILFFALLMRLEPYPHIHGGQDQGVYVSMSAYLQQNGTVFIEDPLARNLSPDLRGIYEDNLPANYYEPGVYYGGQKDYVFQFYHLHPMWMSIFAEIFGEGARVYSLVFFALVSILFLGLLCVEFTGSGVACIALMFLLAVNPLHVFFSKWPVTEVVALAFSSVGIYYTAVAYRFREQARLYRIVLCVAFFSFSCLFLTRITGFLYLPLLIAFAFAVKASEATSPKCYVRDSAIFSYALLLAYGSSIAYGLLYSPNYAADIYTKLFDDFIGLRWQIGLPVVLCCVAGSLIIIFGRGFKFLSGLCARGLDCRSLPLNLAVPIWLVFLALLNLGQTLSVAYSSHWDSHALIGLRWGLSGGGTPVLAQGLVLNWLIYTSPIVVITGLLYLWKRPLGAPLALLAVLPITALTLLTLRSPIIYYQYYYSRYLLSEAVPYLLLIFVAVLFRETLARGQKGLFLALIGISASFFSTISFTQSGASEGAESKKILTEVTSGLTEKDLLLVSRDGWTIPKHAIITPLKLFYQVNTFVLENETIRLSGQRFSENFETVKLLSPKPINDSAYKPTKEFLHRETVVERTHTVPMAVVTGWWSQRMYLYELRATQEQESDLLPSGSLPFNHDSSFAQRLMLSGWHDGGERTSIWSSAESSILLKPSMFAEGRLPAAVEIRYEAFAASEDRPVKLQIKLCDSSNTSYVSKSSGFSEVMFSLRTEALSRGEHCIIEFAVPAAISPSRLGWSIDSRELGVRVSAMKFIMDQADRVSTQ